MSGGRREGRFQFRPLAVSGRAIGIPNRPLLKGMGAIRESPYSSPNPPSGAKHVLPELSPFSHQVTKDEVPVPSLI